MENQDLRERLEIMESLQLGSSSDISSDPANSDYKKLNALEDMSNQNKREVASEILQLRKDKRKLNERIKQLEIDNLSLQSKLNPNFTHAEPTRTHLQATPQAHMSRNRQIIKPYTLTDNNKQNVSQNSQIGQQNSNHQGLAISTSPYSASSYNNNAVIHNPLEDITNQQEGYSNLNCNSQVLNFNNHNNNNNAANNGNNTSNQLNKGEDTSTEQKTRFVRREQSNQSSKKYLRENSTKVSLGTNNSYIGGVGGHHQNQLNNYQQYQPPQQQQSISTTPPHQYKISNSSQSNNNQSTTQSNLSFYGPSQVPMSSNVVSHTENDCPSKSPNLYTVKRQYPREPQPINLSNSHLYSFTNVQTTTSTNSSSNVPKTAFVLKEAKQEELQNYQLQQQQNQQINVNRSINISSINSGQFSNSSSSSGYYFMMNATHSNNNNNNNSNNCNGGRALLNNNPNYSIQESKSPNRITKASETNGNWRAKTTPKNVKQRSITGSKKPPRTQEDGSRWCKTPLQQRPELPSLTNNNCHNISQVN